MNPRQHDDALPTARTTLRTGYVRVLVFCNSCRHQADAALDAIVESRRGADLGSPADLFARLARQTIRLMLGRSLSGPHA
jgi:hypothetical protein